MHIKHSRLYNELQEKIDRDTWHRYHRLAAYSMVAGAILGIIISIIIN